VRRREPKHYLGLKTSRSGREGADQTGLGSRKGHAGMEPRPRVEERGRAGVEQGRTKHVLYANVLYI
jgi:hypothetical protein